MLCDTHSERLTGRPQSRGRARGGVPCPLPPSHCSRRCACLALSVPHALRLPSSGRRSLSSDDAPATELTLITRAITEYGHSRGHGHSQLPAVFPPSRCRTRPCTRAARAETHTTLAQTHEPLDSRPLAPAAATCAAINIPSSDKSAGTGTKTTTQTVAVAWSVAALRARLVQSRAAFAPVCCRRARPEHPRCSRHGVGALDFPCSDDGYSGSGDATCTANSGASTSTFVFAGASDGTGCVGE